MAAGKISAEGLVLVGTRDDVLRVLGVLLTASGLVDLDRAAIYLTSRPVDPETLKVPRGTRMVAARTLIEETRMNVPHQLVMPASVAAALEFLRICRELEDPRTDLSVPLAGRGLDRSEDAARRAALELLRNYFAGELALDLVRLVPRGDGDGALNQPAHAPA